MDNFDKQFNKAQKAASAIIGLVVAGSIVFGTAIIVIGVLVLKHFNIL